MAPKDRKRQERESGKGVLPRFASNGSLKRENFGNGSGSLETIREAVRKNHQENLNSLKGDQFMTLQQLGKHKRFDTTSKTRLNLD